MASEGQLKGPGLHGTWSGQVCGDQVLTGTSQALTREGVEQRVIVVEQSGLNKEKKQE